MRIEFINKSEMGYENKYEVGARVKITEHTYLRTNLKKHTVYTVNEVLSVNYPTFDNKKAYLYAVEDKDGKTVRFDETQIQLFQKGNKI